MPEKKKNYKNVIFAPEVIREARDLIKTMAPKVSGAADFDMLDIQLSAEEELTYDTEDEFFADYRKGFVSSHCGFHYHGTRLAVSTRKTDCSVAIWMQKRPDVEKIFHIFDSNLERSRVPIEIPKKRKPQIFIGHGHDSQWKNLKDHLHEKHGCDVECYESGATAGLTISEVIEDLLATSSIAILILTGEDIDAVGTSHARENVIHELGLFQGRLGRRRAIILLEEGVQEFSNIYGINQIRFKPNNIQETFGEVLATIRREFPEN